MLGKPISDYIWLGLKWRYLQDAQVGWNIHGDTFVLSNLDILLAELERFNLPVTYRAASDLRSLRAELVELPKDTILSAQHASSLQSTLRDLQKVLHAECAGNIAYIVTDKRLNTQKLINSPDQLFAPGVYDALPEIAKLDFKEAGLCIAFERPTAAAFHLLRGTEDVLRTLYRSLIKRNRISPLLWAGMVDAIKRRRTSPPPELVGVLDHLRRAFRNPTQHPDKVYDIQEVQDLYSLCIDATTRMTAMHGWDSDA